MLKKEPDRVSPRSDLYGEKLRHANPLVDSLSKLNCNPTYFKEGSDSCYWFDSKGMSLYISNRCEVYDEQFSDDLPVMMDSVFRSVYFNEKINMGRFSSDLLSTIRQQFDLECDDDGSITVFLGWKSIALIILSARNPGVGDAEVMIGIHGYNITC
jgi:hypothetical protein